MSVERTFGLWLKQRRKQQDLTQAQLAELVGCSPVLITKIETGERRPSRHVAERLLESLDVPRSEWEAILKLARVQPEAAREEVSTASPALEAALPELTMPSFSTSFIGREEEEGATRRLLAGPAGRIITLTGPGGVGKTRLALQVAEGWRDHMRDGVTFVTLAPLRDRSLLFAAIAQALGLKQAGDQAPGALVKRYLRERQLLLVLDNLEQMAGAGELLEELLDAAPRLQLLVTSRASLGMPREQVLVVPPLSLPAIDEQLPLAALYDSDAVQLFIERLESCSPDLVVDAEAWRAIAEICVRLDGLPLAIELAAARCRRYTPTNLLAHLDNRLGLLTRAPAELPDRHQTLRRTIDWSYQLLEPGQRRLFEQLAVFAGGGDLEDVLAVASQDEDAAGSADGQVDLLDTVEELIDQSMVRGEKLANGTLRLLLLETIHEYALERLRARGAEQTLRARHAAHYLAKARRLGALLTGPHQQSVLERLERDHHNLRGALAWCRDHDPAALMQLATALWRFWELRGHLHEGRDWLDQALVGASMADSLAHAEVLSAAGCLAERQADYQRAADLLAQAHSLRRALNDQRGAAFVLMVQGRVANAQSRYDLAMEYASEGLVLGRQARDRWVIAGCLNELGWALSQQGEYEQAQRYLEESLQLVTELGDRERIAKLLCTLGAHLSNQGDYAEAQRCFAESAARSRQLGDKHGLSVNLTNMGWLCVASGEYDQARRYLEEGRTLSAELDDKAGTAFCLGILGDLAFDEGAYERAKTLYCECLMLALQLQHQHLQANCLQSLGLVAAAQDRPRLATTLFGGAEQLLMAVGAKREPSNQDRYDAMVQQVLTSLGPDAFDEAWEEGEAMTVDELVALALREPVGDR